MKGNRILLIAALIVAQGVAGLKQVLESLPPGVTYHGPLANTDLIVEKCTRREKANAVLTTMDNTSIRAA